MREKTPEKDVIIFEIPHALWYVIKVVFFCALIFVCSYFGSQFYLSQQMSNPHEVSEQNLTP